MAWLGVDKGPNNWNEVWGDIIHTSYKCNNEPAKPYSIAEAPTLVYKLLTVLQHISDFSLPFKGCEGPRKPYTPNTLNAEPLKASQT